MVDRAVHPVILCGGVGSRLWPESTPERPKAFLPLTSDLTLLQETAVRVRRIAGAAAAQVVASRTHVEEVRGEFEDVGVSCRVIAEPGGRGSAPAIAAACLEIAAAEPEALVLVAACDHFVPDAAAFADGVAASLDAARNGAIVTFGVKPDGPSTAYGYIRPGDALEGAVRRVAAFVEKPDAARAEGLLAEGCLWNSGNFVFRVDVMLAELESREPVLMAAVRAGRERGTRSDGVIELAGDFLAAPNIAIDVAVMEKTDRAAVLPIDYAWSDLGAWDSVLEAARRDVAGNAVKGRVMLEDCQGALVRADAGARVVAIGLKNVAVIVENGAVLVCDLSRAQSVRIAIEGMED
ncbi:MAG TPA: sugar phosphate nucleotidyltransferase [Caulobacteraceae bacterium]|jgi:mannose-1-phosphate guanylyltransferase